MSLKTYLPNISLQRYSWTPLCGACWHSDSGASAFKVFGCCRRATMECWMSFTEFAPNMFRCFIFNEISLNFNAQHSCRYQWARKGPDCDVVIQQFTTTITRRIGALIFVSRWCRLIVAALQTIQLKMLRFKLSLCRCALCLIPMQDSVELFVLIFLNLCVCVCVCVCVRRDWMPSAQTPGPFHGGTCVFLMPWFCFTFLWAAEPDHWLRTLTSLTDASLTAWVWLPSCFLWQTGVQLSGTDDPASLGLCLMMPSKSKHQRAVCQTLLIAEIAQHGQMHLQSVVYSLHR